MVSSVAWTDNFVAWASAIGVRVYDLSEKCSLGLIKWEEPKDALLTQFRCNLRWSNSMTLLIGWVDIIRICVIRRRNSVEVSTRDLPGFIVDPSKTQRNAINRNEFLINRIHFSFHLSNGFLYLRSGPVGDEPTGGARLPTRTRPGNGESATARFMCHSVQDLWLCRDLHRQSLAEGVIHRSAHTNFIIFNYFNFWQLSGVRLQRLSSRLSNWGEPIFHCIAEGHRGGQLVRKWRSRAVAHRTWVSLRQSPLPSPRIP